MLTTIGWIVLGPLAAGLVTFVAGRLLGARRGWVVLMFSGVIGFTGGVIAAGALSGWGWSQLAMVLLTLLFGTLFTMAVALGLDLVAPIGSLRHGAEAGLVSVHSPLAEARSKLLPLRRYREVVGLARRNGVVARGVTAESLPAGVRRTVEEAGGIFVKLGQVASTRSDVLPRAWCDELAGLRTGAAPADEGAMRPHIAAQLGGDPDALYARFDWTPIAAASISQVYRAELHDGSPVIVKVQRPHLDATLERDGAAVMQIAQLIERRTPLGLTVRPAELAREFLDGVAEELDFRIELANAGEMRAALAGLDRVRIPEVHPQLSGERILTQELIAAPNIGELVAGGAPADGVDLAELGDRLVGLFMHQMFTVGTFHADPHPGNILIEPDGTIVLIDLGAVGRLGQAHRDAMLEMMAAASAGDAPALRHALSRITVFDRRIDVRELDVALEAFLVRHLRTSGGISTAAFEDLAVLIGQYGIRLPRWFGTLSRTLVTLEGTIKGVDPSFSLVDAAKRHAESMFGHVVGSDVQATLQRELLAELPRLRRLPERVDELLGQAASGSLSAQVSVLADRRDVRLVSRLVDRLVLAIIAAATTIASVILIGIDAGPSLSGDVSMNEVLGYFGLFAGAVLGFRVVAGIIRDGET